MLEAAVTITFAYAIPAIAVGIHQTYEADMGRSERTMAQAVAVATLWPLAVLILTVRGCREWIEEDQHRRRLEKAKRRRELEEEYRKAIEELEVDQ